jgi:segregation and condensation protein B
MNIDFQELNKRKIESILFVANRPISLKKIVKLLDLPPDTIVSAIKTLNEKYKREQNAFFIEEIGEGYIFATCPEFDDIIRNFYSLEEQMSLTDLNIEVLAIIAYNQPITRIEVDAVRGNVDSSFHIKTLLEKGFLKMVGKKIVPGRPFLYGTTKQFLIYFGLKSLSDLPKISEIKEEFKSRETKNETDTLPGFE